MNTSVLESGVNSIWSTDEEFQTTVLRGILKNIRNMEQDTTDAMFEYLKGVKAFYAPHDEYLINHFGTNINLSEYGIFNNGLNTLLGRLAIPIRLMNDDLIGFIGYSNTNDFNPEGIVVKYLYPPKGILDKSKYMFITRDEFVKAVSDGYICIVDGIFDKIALQCNGINAVSLCGSIFSEYHKLYLSLIKNLIIISDNDDAGNKLANKVKKYRPSAVQIVQSTSKDIDSYISNKSNLTNLKATLELMRLEDYRISHRLINHR